MLGDATAIKQDHPPGRLIRALQAAVPVAALSYPLLIQPLMSFSPGMGDEELDMMANVRNADSNPMNQLFWIGLLGLAILLFRDRLGRFRALLAAPAPLLIAGYLVLAVTSVAWSAAPDIAIRRVLLQIVVVAIVLGGSYLAEDRRLVVRGCAWLFALAVAVNLPLALILPGGRMGGALGIYSNKNILGLVMALAVMVLVHAARTASMRLERALLAIGAAMAIGTLVLSDSETSLLLTVFAPALAWGIVALSRIIHVRLLPVIGLILLWIAGLALLYVAAGGTGEALLTKAFGDATFSGRTEIWAFMIESTRGRLLLGAGYASFWGTGDNSYVAELAPGFIGGLLQAHNGYLDVLIETGLVGLFLLVAIVLAGFGLLDNSPPDADRSFKRMILSVMLFATLHNMLESSWFRGFSVVWLFYLLVLGLAARRSAFQDLR
jgi:exopolysaccharide production protein ExoQ